MPFFREIKDNELKKYLGNPLNKDVDMHGDNQGDVREICTAGIDKYGKNWENAAKHIKEQLDKKYGNQWHVCIGEGYSYSISHNAQNMMHIYYGEQGLGVLVFRV